MKLTVGALKGGSGKTTTAMHLAFGLARTGRVLLVDADPQARTADDWRGAVAQRHQADPTTAPPWPSSIVVVPWANPDDLRDRIADVADDYAHIVVDTGGESDRLLTAALLATDELLMPSAPTPPEVRRLPATIEVAARVDQVRPIMARVLFTRCRDRSVAYRESVDLLTGYGVPIMDARIRQLDRFALALGTAPEELGDYEEVLTEMLAPEPAGEVSS